MGVTDCTYNHHHLHTALRGQLRASMVAAQTEPATAAAQICAAAGALCEALARLAGGDDAQCVIFPGISP